MTRILIATILIALLSANFSRGADASYKHWRQSLKAAEQARYKRDFDTMRQILEGSAAEAQKIGSLSSAENAYWLAFAYTQLGMVQEAIQLYDTELERIGPKPKAIKLQVIRGVLMTLRGELYFRAHEYDKALASATDGKAVLEDAAGKYHPGLFDAHRTIGRIHALRKNLPEAEKWMRSALGLAESRQTYTQTEWSGSDQQTILYVTEPMPARVTLAAIDLGKVLMLEGKFEEAESAYTKALKNAEAVYPKDSIMRALPLRGLAEAEFKLGRTKEFEKHTQQIYEIVSKNSGYETGMLLPLWLKFGAEVDASSPRAAETLKMLAKVFEKQNYEFSDLGKNAMAISVNNEQVDWKRAAAVQDALIKLADSYSSIAPAKAGLVLAEIANFASDHGKTELANDMYLRILKSQQSASDKGILIAVLGKLAERKAAEGKREEALEYYRSATKALRDKYGNDMRVAAAMDTEASVLKDLGRNDEASKVQAEAQEVRKKTIGK